MGLVIRCSPINTLAEGARANSESIMVGQSCGAIGPCRERLFSAASSLRKRLDAFAEGVEVCLARFILEECA